VEFAGVGASKLNTGQLDLTLRRTLNDIDDLRHLYAHNFAGVADPLYLQWPRHVLSVAVTLSSGAHFSGTNVSLDVPHLRYYCQSVRHLLEKFC
jgi:hypothetical protein